MNERLDDDRWAVLALEFPEHLTSFVRRRLDEHGRMSFIVDELAADADVDERQAEMLLERLVAMGALTIQERDFVTCVACLKEVDRADAENGACPYCDEPLDLPDDAWRTERRYVREAAPARDVSWVLVVHGMNTRGTWQEQLTWRIAKSYRRAVPVYIHKYGKVSLGVLLRSRQRQLADLLAERIREVAGPLDDHHLGTRPDVVAHSFGTWLVATALLRHPDIQLGRIILVGGVVRPDFDWDGLLRHGRVEAVLNHFGTRDRWVPLAQFFIPDTGPSGTHGLRNSDQVLNCQQEGFGHSSFFHDRLAEAHDEVWGPFLRQPVSRLHEAVPTVLPKPWRPVSWLLRASLPRVMLLAIVAGGTAWLVAALVLGSSRLFEVLRTLLGSRWQSPVPVHIHPGVRP